nr:hypothetical protein [Tanacetum cinerariifolium]
TLVEAARTMLIFSRAPLFLWDKAIATACFTQTAPLFTNDREDIGKLGAKGDIGFFIGYSSDSCAYRVYNRRTKKIMKTMNVSFDELSAMAFEQYSSKPGLQNIVPTPTNSSSLAINFPNTSQDVDKLNLQQHHVQQQGSHTHLQSTPVTDNVPNALFDGNTFVNP